MSHKDERDKYLTEKVLDGCAQDEGFHHDSDYLCCSRCGMIVNGRNPEDQCLGATNFSTGDGFFKLYKAAKQKDWWPSFRSAVLCRNYEDVLEDYLDPDIMADAIFSYLKHKEIRY